MMTELLSISRWLVLFYLANEPSLLRILSDLFYYLFVCLFEIYNVYIVYFALKMIFVLLLILHVIFLFY